MPDEVFINPFNKQMTLYDQLMFYWERGFYSVVRRKGGDFLIVTTPLKQDHKDSYGDYEGMQYTYPCDSVEEAKKQVFDCECILSRSNPCAMAAPEHWEIVDTIHPSELMGKGFQVGDRVKCVDGSHLDSRIFTVEKANKFGRYTLENVNGEMLHRELKPVLPVTTKPERKKRQFRYLFTARCFGGINLGDSCTIRQNDNGNFIAYPSRSSNEFRFSDRIGQSMATFTDGELIDYVYESNPEGDTTTYYLMPVDLRQKEEGVRSSDDEDD